MKSTLLAFTLFAFSLGAQEIPLPKAAAAASTTNAKNILLIDPKMRAQDYVQAFDMLRKDKPTQKIMIHLSNGAILSSITEIIAAQNGTLLLIKYASTSGNKYQVVPIEDIAEVGYSPS